jgi:hypothetical protein
MKSHPGATSPIARIFVVDDDARLRPAQPVPRAPRRVSTAADTATATAKLQSRAFDLWCST